MEINLIVGRNRETVRLEEGADVSRVRDLELLAMTVSNGDRVSLLAKGKRLNASADHSARTLQECGVKNKDKVRGEDELIEFSALSPNFFAPRFMLNISHLIF
mmetsp:Transcript_2097/g.3702  ORF Transcript_2097/g.3702 Transcript_2097/m.3702 type:complete len:103 (+) Transcript_2097:117-425(+)